MSDETSTVPGGVDDEDYDFAIAPIEGNEDGTPSGELPADVIETVKQIQDEAQESFSLDDFLDNEGEATVRKVYPVVLKPDVLEEWSSLSKSLADLERGLLSAIDPDIRESMEQAIAELTPRVEDAYSEVLKVTIAVHLKSIPKIAVKVVQRKARKAYPEIADGSADAEKSAAFVGYLNELLLSEGIEKVVTSSGRELSLGDNPARSLMSKLPNNQFEALEVANEALSYKKVVANSAINVGF